MSDVTVEQGDRATASVPLRPGVAVTTPTRLSAAVAVPTRPATAVVSAPVLPGGSAAASLTPTADALLIGLPGPQGPPGPAGPPGGTYEFALVAATSPPANPGELRLNNADQGLVTTFYLSTETVHGVDITDVLAAHDVGYTWYFYDKADPNVRVEYEVTATPLSNGTWFEYQVAVEENFGPIPLGPIYGAGITAQPQPVRISYHHIQTVPAAVWTIDHHLGFAPNVTIVDSSHREVLGEVDYPSASTVIVTFSSSFGGEAFLS